MRIIVFDVAAEIGGALSVLYEFYNEFNLKQENEYIFVVSLPELQETSNIKILRFPWIKKSWGHRLFFDHFIAPKLIKKYDADRVLSLQNVIVSHTSVYQSVYVHNALPFSEYKFKFRENWLLWVYQNIIGCSILHSIKKSSKVIVQANWMKEKIIDRLNISPDKIMVLPPKINNVSLNEFSSCDKSEVLFFYPASGMMFKNHSIIVNACLLLKKNSIHNYKVIFTLNEDENKSIRKLVKIINRNSLPIEFVGNLTKHKVIDYYQKSILIFPSYIETIGLPLLEAAKFNIPIIVADLEYSREVLDGYERVMYFNPHSSSNLKEKMMNYFE